MQGYVVGDKNEPDGVMWLAIKGCPAVPKACLLAVKSFMLAFLVPVPSATSVALSTLLVPARAGFIFLLRVVAVSRVVLVALAKSLGIP